MIAALRVRKFARRQVPFHMFLSCIVLVLVSPVM